MLISFIVPVYNVPQIFLERCLESLCNQTSKNFEVIIVDDESTDCSTEICKKFCSKYSCARYYRKDNGGVSSARNYGLDVCDGDYIVFVDGDDYVEKDLVAKVEKIISSTRTDFLQFSVARNFPNKETYPIVKLKEGYNQKEDFLASVLRQDDNVSAVYGKVIKKNIIDDFRFNEKVCHGENFSFVIKAASCANSIYFVNEYLYHYVFNSKSLTKNIDDKNAYIILTGFEDAKETLDKLGLEFNQLYIDRVADAIITSFISGYMRPFQKKSLSNLNKEANKYLKHNLVSHVLTKYNKKNKGKTRSFILFCIKKRFYLLLRIIAFARYIQMRVK